MAYSNCFPDILVLDEVHNFAIPTEILAMLTRNKKNIKIIIMSATLNASIFQEYYKNISSDIEPIKILGRGYPVEKHYDSSEKCFDIITSQYNQGKNILFFVPGKKEIDDNIALFRVTFGENAEIFPLHADLPKEEQQKLLTKLDNKKPRIIVCTNVAEESITIPYIDVVVDL